MSGILNNSVMLENVNAVNVNAENVLSALVYNFGDGGAISTCDGGVIKLQAKELGNSDLTCISNMLQYADVKIKRSGAGVGMLVLFIPKPNSVPYTDELVKTIESIQAD